MECCCQHVPLTYRNGSSVVETGEHFYVVTDRDEYRRSNEYSPVRRTVHAVHFEIGLEAIDLAAEGD